MEHATLTLAAQAGIRVAETRALPLPGQRHAVAVKRFDRQAGCRTHSLSAHVVLRAAGEPMGYPELAQWLRRHAPAATHQAQMADCFRRMVFNILLDNTDDHEKNHVVLMNDQGRYDLSPAFDVLPSAQGLGYQQMRVGRDDTDSTLDNALSEHAQFGLTRAQAQDHIAAVQAVVARWPQHFQQQGVKAADIELLRAFIRPQR
jgi:serine/threonine-protein kinase HipA